MGQKEQYQMDCIKAGLEEQHFILLEHLKDKIYIITYLQTQQTADKQSENRNIFWLKTKINIKNN